MHDWLLPVSLLTYVSSNTEFLLCKPPMWLQDGVNVVECACMCTVRENVSAIISF